MGGVGSGEWYRLDTKDTAESQLRVDIRYLKRQGYLSPGYSGNLAWICGGEPTGNIRFRVTEGFVHLVYRQRRCGGEWETVVEPVPLTWTLCHYGGKRPWFRCPLPGCGRRVAILYGAGRYFGCRHCYQLKYSSQRENRYLSADRQCEKIIRRLGGDPEDDFWPDKPKHMHWKTYHRLLDKAMYYQSEAEAGLASIIMRLGGKGWMPAK